MLSTKLATADSSETPISMANEIAAPTGTASDVVALPGEAAEPGQWLLQWLEVKKAAPRLADAILDDPDTLDQASINLDMPLGSALDSRLSEATSSPRDPQAALAEVYRLYRNHRNLVSTELLLGRLPIGEAGHVYADLADRALTAVIDICEATFVARHGRLRSGRHALVALGRFGARDLTATSGLDLLFLYDFDDASPASDGEHPLEGNQYYARLAQRLVAAAKCNFGDAPMFDVSFLLRPRGAKGPMAMRLSDFKDAFAAEASTADAMALARARLVAATHAAFAAKIDAALRRAVRTAAAHREVRSDVTSLRRQVQQDKASARIWDIEGAPGGLVDVDFIVQGLALAHAPAFASAAPNDTVAVIAALTEAKALAPTDADLLRDALVLYRTTLQLLRIAAPADPMPDALAAILAERTGSGDARQLALRLRRTQREVRRLFDRAVVRARRRDRFKPA